MKIEIKCVGKLKSKSPEEALIKRYQDRLNVKVDIMELSEKVSEEDVVQKMLYAKNGQRCFLIALDGTGKQVSSEELSCKISSCMGEGYDKVIFFIGGFKGLPREVVARSDLVMAWGTATWPHQLVRAMLMEQIYRSFQLIKGAPYHY